MIKTKTRAVVGRWYNSLLSDPISELCVGREKGEIKSLKTTEGNKDSSFSQEG